jgi:hypothetical protein
MRRFHAHRAKPVTQGSSLKPRSLRSGQALRLLFQVHSKFRRGSCESVRKAARLKASLALPEGRGGDEINRDVVATPGATFDPTPNLDRGSVCASRRAQLEY